MEKLLVWLYGRQLEKDGRNSALEPLFWLRTALGQNFGLDRWVAKCALKEKFPQLFRTTSNRNATVADLWVERKEEGSLPLLFRRHFQDCEL